MIISECVEELNSSEELNYIEELNCIEELMVVMNSIAQVDFSKIFLNKVKAYSIFSEFNISY